MKRFEFPLDRVKHWREGQAALEELKLEQLRGNLEALRQEKLNLRRDYSDSERTVLGQPSMAGAELESLDAYRLHTRNKVREFENQERSAAVEIEEQRQRVIQARRNVELLERLKQKALDRWQEESDREQETFAAELYLARWTRRR